MSAKTATLPAIVALAVLLAACGRPPTGAATEQPTGPSDIVVVDSIESFDAALENEAAVAVDFYADWCGPCKVLLPTVESLATEYKGKVTILKVDVDALPKLAERYGIRSIPTMLFFRDGKKVDSVVGVADKQTYAKILDSMLTG